MHFRNDSGCQITDTVEYVVLPTHGSSRINRSILKLNDLVVIFYDVLIGLSITCRKKALKVANLSRMVKASPDKPNRNTYAKK